MLRNIAVFDGRLAHGHVLVMPEEKMFAEPDVQLKVADRLASVEPGGDEDITSLKVAFTVSV